MGHGLVDAAVVRVTDRDAMDHDAFAGWRRAHEHVGPNLRALHPG